MIKIIAIIVIIVLSISTATGWSISIPKGSIPGYSSGQDVSEKAGTSDAADQKIVSSGKRYQTSSSLYDSVVVNSILLPIKNEGYLSGQSARIFIEIKNNKKNQNNRDLKGLAVRVINDDELNIIPDSARWLKLYSLDELCDIKNKIYSSPLDIYPEIENTNKCQIIKQSECMLFSYNNFTSNNSEETKYIFNMLHKLYDVAWVNKKDVKFYVNDNFVWINDSENNSYIKIQKRNSTKMDFSDGRSYDLRVCEKNNRTCVNYTNTIIGFNVDVLSPKESIIFYYDIKPKKNGFFNSETIVRSYDLDLSHLQDFSQLIKVEVKDSNPEFKINPRPSNSEVYKYNDNILSLLKGHPYIDVSYDITYVGGASETYCDNISISFDDPSEDCFYVDENGNRNDSIFKRSNFKNYSYFGIYDTQSIPIRVAFSTKGSHILPGIVINDIRYAFNDQKIDVNTWFFRHLDIIFLFVSMISLIITAAELHATKRDLDEMARIMKGKKVFLRSPKYNPGTIKQLGKLRKFIKDNPEILALFLLMILFIVLLISN